MDSVFVEIQVCSAQTVSEFYVLSLRPTYKR